MSHTLTDGQVEKLREAFLHAEMHFGRNPYSYIERQMISDALALLPPKKPVDLLESEKFKSTVIRMGAMGLCGAEAEIRATTSGPSARTSPKRAASRRNAT